VAEMWGKEEVGRQKKSIVTPMQLKIKYNFCLNMTRSQKIGMLERV
jgi:hypothetical protein